MRLGCSRSRRVSLRSWFLPRMLVEEREDALPVARLQRRVGDDVRHAGERQEVELLPGAEERIGEQQRLTEVDVVVGGAVDDEERPGEVLRVGQDAVAG